MPHLKIEYTANLDPAADMAGLCQQLAIAMAAMRDGEGKPVFPLNGTRVLAYPAPYHAVAGGQAGHGFVYLNLRITAGRTQAAVTAVGDRLLEVVKAHFAQTGIDTPVGITLHIDEGQQVYEGKHRLP